MQAHKPKAAFSQYYSSPAAPACCRKASTGSESPASGRDSRLLLRLRSRLTLRLRCTYDNTLSNPGVARALSDAGQDEPADVYLGETTLDEMCLGIFGVVVE